MNGLNLIVRGDNTQQERQNSISYVFTEYRDMKNYKMDS